MGGVALYKYKVLKINKRRIIMLDPRLLPLTPTGAIRDAFNPLASGVYNAVTLAVNIPRAQANRFNLINQILCTTAPEERGTLQAQLHAQPNVQLNPNQTLALRGSLRNSIQKAHTLLVQAAQAPPGQERGVLEAQAYHHGQNVQFLRGLGISPLPLNTNQ